MSKYKRILGLHLGVRYKWEPFDGMSRTGVDVGKLTIEWSHDEGVLTVSWDILGYSVSVGKVDPDWAGGKVIGPFYFTRGI